MIARIRAWWSSYYERHTGLAQFAMFVLISVGMTVLQLVLMPVFRWIFNQTPLAQTTFQALALGTTPDGTPFYMFDYAGGPLPDGGGGLAYFLAVQVTILIAQVLNFFLQRSIAFKSNSNIWWAAMWYAIAYVVITFAASFLQSFYKAPVYAFFISTWAATGETWADMATMIINALVQFCVFFPIFKIIFRQVPPPSPARETTGRAAMPRS